jgi:hypothetical protein
MAAGMHLVSVGFSAMTERGPNRWFFDAWSRVYDWPPVLGAP